MPNSSRAICAVVMASRGVRQPAVFGITRTPSDLMSSKKRWPVPARAVSRRTETVTMPACEACTALAIICGEGYPAVPSSSREPISTP